MEDRDYYRQFRSILTQDEYDALMNLPTRAEWAAIEKSGDRVARSRLVARERAALNARDKVSLAQIAKAKRTHTSDGEFNELTIFPNNPDLDLAYKVAGVGVLAAAIVGGIYWLGKEAEVTPATRENPIADFNTADIYKLIHADIFYTLSNQTPDTMIGKIHPLPYGYRWVESTDKAAAVLGGQQRVAALKDFQKGLTFWTAQDAAGNVLDLPWLRKE